jgi:hypothetical protein
MRVKLLPPVLMSRSKCCQLQQHSHKFTFSASYLSSDVTNEMLLSLTFTASGISVTYDALRLENDKR